MFFSSFTFTDVSVDTLTVIISFSLNRGFKVPDYMLENSASQ